MTMYKSLMDVGQVLYSFAVCDFANILVGAGGCHFPCKDIYGFNVAL